MQTSFREIILQVFRDRSLSNPGYSLRSFARDLEMGPANLSEVLSNKKGLSAKKAAAVARGLKLPEWQQQMFCDLVAKEHAKSPTARTEAKKRLTRSRQENHVKILKQSALKSITSWIDLAILELTYLKEFKPSISYVAKKIGAEEALVKAAMARLKVANLIEIDPVTGRWADVSPLFTTTDGIPSESIRDFHRTVLQLGLKKLENPDVNARTVKSVVFSLSHENKARAKKILDEAIAKVVSLADESTQNREDVMCFSTQLFSLIESGRNDP